MKKYLPLIVFLVAFVCLLVCAFTVGCNVDVAHAVTVNSSNGVVLPNILPFYDFSSFYSVDRLSLLNLDGSARDGIYLVDEISFSFSNGLLYFNNTASQAQLGAIVWTCPSNAYYVLSIGITSTGSATSSTTSSASVRRFMVDSSSGTSVITSFSYTLPYSADGSYFNTICYYSSSMPSFVSGYKYIFYFNCENSWRRNMILSYIKLEKFVSRPSSASYAFTGFVVPGITYEVPEQPVSPYDSWDGVVKKNYFRSPDFYEYPYYTTETTLSNIPNNLWFTDRPTSALYRSDGYTFIDHGSLSGVQSYGAFYQALLTDRPPSTDVTFTVSIRTSAYRLTVSIHGLSTYHTETWHAPQSGGPTYFHDVILSVTLPYSEIASASPFICQFLVEKDNLTYDPITRINYTKLESGDLFTGYYPVDHTDDQIVNENLLLDYNFSTIPGTDLVDNQWIVSQYANDYVITYGSTGGIRIRSGSGDFALTYYVKNYDFYVGQWVTFALRSSTNTPFTLYYNWEESNLNEYFLMSASTLNEYFSFQLVSNDQTVTQLDYLSISLIIPSNSDITLYYAKLERGDAFTGFSANESFVRQESYIDGYDAGYIAGADTYAQSNHILAFNNVESPGRINQGWRDFGFDSAANFASSSFDLYSYWYRDLGYPQVSGYQPIYTDQTQTTIQGVALYVSRDGFLDPDVSLSPSSHVLIVSVFENYSQLDVYDELYPSNWNPVEYPNVRTFSLTITRGFADLLDQYYESALNTTQTTAYSNGYKSGYNDGKATGYALAEEHLSSDGWLGFISAFVDTPIHVLTSLLDFEVFGFNLLNIIKILVLVVMVTAVIRLFTDGKVKE